MELLQTVLLVAQGFGLVSSTIIGVKQPLTSNVAPTIVIFVGLITGVGGGVMHDLLTDEIPLVLRKEIHRYAAAAFCGAALFLILDCLFPDGPANRLIAISAILILRRVSFVGNSIRRCSSRAMLKS